MDMATINSYLRNQHGDLEEATDSVLYGPPTQNDKHGQTYPTKTK
jgi:hypothetical protein